MQNVALLFGSFNPPHKGHTALAQYILDNNIAEQVWFVVSPHNPLKEEWTLAPFDHRVEMVRLATKNIPNTKVETIENTLSKPSYTFNTITHLKKLYPNKNFTLLAGSDIANQMKKWYKHEELQKMVQFLYYPRGEDSPICSPELENAPKMNINSTEIREGNHEHWIDESVNQYMSNHKIYDAMRTLTYYSELILRDPTVADNYFERGKLHYALNNFGKAINDFRKALDLNPAHSKARRMMQLTNSILDFRHFDIFNP